MGVLFLLRCFCFAASDYGESVQLDMAHAMFCLERRPTTNGRYNKRQRRGSHYANGIWQRHARVGFEIPSQALNV